MADDSDKEKKLPDQPQPATERPSQEVAPAVSARRLDAVLNPPALEPFRRINALVNPSALEPLRRINDLVNPPALRSLAQVTEPLRPALTAVQRIQTDIGQMSVGLEPYRLEVSRLVGGLANAIAPAQSFIERMNLALPVQHGVGRILENIQAAMRPVLSSSWLETIRKGFREFDEALQNAEALGRLGWTVPLNASLPECVELLRAATTAEDADKAFTHFYSKDGGAHRAELVEDLLSQPDLAEWRDLLGEVAWAIEAAKYRVAVPALLGAFEGAAYVKWTTRFGHESGRTAFFNKKIADLEPGSYDYLTWSAVRAFVEALYKEAKQTKPLLLNRHWVLHGRGPADAELADCVRLLQAIHTAVYDT
jgi:hypothetical protein